MPLAAGNRVLIKIDKQEEKTAGGILMPEQTRNLDRAYLDVGTVQMVGKDAYPEHEYHNGPWCKEGDHVYFTPGGHRVKNPSEGAEYELIMPRAIVGFVEDHDRK